jgi:hypothetical protein
MTAGSSIQAMIRKVPPHRAHVSMSMPKTRLRRCDQVMLVRRLAGVSSLPWSQALRPGDLPRFAGVTEARSAGVGSGYV